MLHSEKSAALAASHAVTASAPRKWLRPAQAADYAGIGRSFLYTLLNNGRVKSHRVGGARLVCIASLDAFIEAQPGDFQDAA